MNKNQKIIESLFFVTTVPLVQKDIVKVFGKDDAPDLKQEVSKLNSLYEKSYLISMQDPYVNPVDSNVIAGHGKTQKECAPGTDCEGSPYVATFSSSRNSYCQKLILVSGIVFVRVKKQARARLTWSSARTMCMSAARVLS